MIKKKVFILLITVIAMSFVGCTKEEIVIPIQKPLIEGIYSGTFTVKYSENGWAPGQTLTSEAVVEFNGGKFASSHKSLRGGGSGNYTKNDTSIIFIDTNYWTADFDWGLILSGEYSFNFDGTRLIISANKNEIGLYEYNLIKQ